MSGLVSNTLKHLGTKPTSWILKPCMFKLKINEIINNYDRLVLGHKSTL